MGFKASNWVLQHCSEGLEGGHPDLLHPLPPSRAHMRRTQGKGRTPSVMSPRAADSALQIGGQGSQLVGWLRSTAIWQFWTETQLSPRLRPVSLGTPPASDEIVGPHQNPKSSPPLDGSCAIWNLRSPPQPNPNHPFSHALGAAGLTLLPPCDWILMDSSASIPFGGP